MAGQPRRDESKSLYSPRTRLTFANGKKVQTASEWRNQRRPEILRLFEENVHGRTPSAQMTPQFEVLSVDKNALDGKAIRKQVAISWKGKSASPKIHLLLYLPTSAKVPVLVSRTELRRQCNDTQGSRNPPYRCLGSCVHRGRHAAERGRIAHSKTFRGVQPGLAANRWPVERILARGYGLATAYYGDIEPDFDGGMNMASQPAVA